jgi:hypothetical protein
MHINTHACINIEQTFINKIIIIKLESKGQSACIENIVKIYTLE